ncbi:hypothetical protein PB2503_10709 [Parvularcula bermudensis HTCC2503]|uniref:DUF3108 domain-containing protein n=1 Tax=Parvularcula bermudensis (strain ATCC BAA-594 / HTCC2503 / KCTC 12087) TaxID=314260 RepID=E0THA3_PARBH|nr:hypothetical protein PB2503_10709 [Parvularcula bermudensis HTCC2503]
MEECPVKSKKVTASLSAIAVLIMATGYAVEDRDYPPEGTSAWRHLFAVDPSPEALAFAPPAPEKTEATRYTAEFKGEIAGFDIGRIYLDIETSPERYAVDYRMRQNGIARWFSDAEATSRARGHFGDQNRITEHYYFNHDYEAEDDQQYVEIYRPYGQRRMHLWTSPTYSFREPVSEGQAADAVDPMSALIGLSFTAVPEGKSPCDREIDVFDGRRLFTLEMRDEGTENLNRRGNNLYNGSAYKCRLHQEKIAGYREKDLGDVNGDLWVYLADVPDPFRTPTFAYVPVMIKGKQGIFTAWLEGENPTITSPDGKTINLGTLQ